MILTGKCKEDFYKWYVRTGNVHYSAPNLFLRLPKSMQYGVYVDFFDSVEIRISMNQFKNTYWYDIEKTGDESDELKTRQEAREQAILKANEIFNKNIATLLRYISDYG